MNFTSGDSASAFIPPQVDDTEIYYYISATSNSGRRNTKPRVAPDGLYKFKVENSVTNISGLNSPDEFYLAQNYPNPFNPTTNIEFRISSASFGGFVSLKVFDVLGNEVSTLISEEKEAGNYEVEFNGSGLPSGVYFYGLNAGNFNKTKKMILLK
jgi:hypothetical protein